MSINDAWEKYLKDNNIVLTDAQRTTTDALIELIRMDTRVLRLFRARGTGKTFMLEHFARFCNTTK